LYQSPPANTHVLCIDELGPLSAKTYAARRWAPAGQPPRVTPDYGRRASVWTFGALEPRTGKALTVCAERRRSCDFTSFLDQVVTAWPEGEIILILDNLSIHRSLEVKLWALAHERVRFLFQPTYAPWLNLIEPWWKTLRSLALKGRRFEGAEELTEAIVEGTKYWNEHCHPYHWRKSYSYNRL
jgi:transposase